MLVERPGIVEYLADEIPDLVAREVGLVVEVVALFGLEPVQEIGCERTHQPLVGDLCGEFGRGHQRFVFRFVADDVYGQRFDAGIFGIEHCSDCLTDDKDAHFLSLGQVPEPIKRPEPLGAPALVVYDSL